MYIQKIIYDSSCNYNRNIFHDSVMENALFDLTKDYIYIVEENDTNLTNNENYNEVNEK